jgi:hypothetical protein
MTKFLRPALLSLSLLASAAAVPALADGADNRNWHPYNQVQNGYNGATYDYGRGYRHILSEDQVRWRLRNQGFHRIHDIDRNHGRYTARARDGHGRPVFVVVSARTGEVLSVRHR